MEHLGCLFLFCSTPKNQMDLLVLNAMGCSLALALLGTVPSPSHTGNCLSALPFAGHLLQYNIFNTVQE